MASNGTARANGRRETPYDAAVVGFKNYWYPIFSGKEITTKPSGIRVMGEQIVLMRGQKDGKIYAMDDECFHRGTLLSVGRGCEFKGTNTITCGYHGWTYDLETGMCVAVLPEGVGSRVPGKVKQRTYPIEERKGIVWIWMGDMAPVPVEEDMPNLMVRDDTIVKLRHDTNYGNWRWHAENVAAGHAGMIHRDSIRLWTQRPIPPYMGGDPVVFEDPDGVGIQDAPRTQAWGKDATTAPKKLPPVGAEFPGLGRWYVPPLWRRILFSPWHRRVRSGFASGQKIHGISAGKLFLPGFYRQPHFPSNGNAYYEWYVPVDEDHYIYAQISCMWGTNPVNRLWKHLWYYLYGKPVGLTNFNNQDIKWVGQTTNFTKRHNANSYPMVKLSQNDAFHTLWREYANENARGVGYKYQNGAKAAKEKSEDREAEKGLPVVAGGSEDSED